MCLFIAFSYSTVRAQSTALKSCNLTWNSQSKNSSESMPCGGGDIGLNVWCENNEIYFYISKSGTFDENNTFLKLGRVRIKLSPNPFTDTNFKQQLSLQDGSVIINGKNGNLSTQVKLWVDVYRPVVHIEINSNHPVKAEAAYESWRYRDRESHGQENNQDSWKWDNAVQVKTIKDSIAFTNNAVQFYHQNKDTSVFDATVREQGLESVKSQLFNPLRNLIFGGMLTGDGMKPAGTYTGKYQNTDFEGWILQSDKAKTRQELDVELNTTYANSSKIWQERLDNVTHDAKAHQSSALKATQNWWKQFWERSYIFIDPENTNPENTAWQAGRNYQLFRYMLGCNAFGKYPTKFNGGLFTFDPVYVNPSFNFTPDFRNWGGGLMTAQNQRLVYWPMLKNGDFDLMKPQFDFYIRALHNAELRSKLYWGHEGAAFTEQN